MNAVKAAGAMPLYPSEARIAVEVMGPERAKEWPVKARYLEDKHGLPPVDELMGGRFWPAVVEYFRVRHGITLDRPFDDTAKPQTISRVRVVPFKPDGKEDFNAAETQASHGRRPPGRRHGARL
jgi:hypothetical protein